MTSRSSFFNLLREDLRRRLWTLILSSLVFFGTFVVAFTMLLQNDVSRYGRTDYGYTHAELIERIVNNLCRDFYGFHFWFALVAIVGAVICGVSGFAYLHSKKQMDFYHSLPIKREMLFYVRLVSGILIYALPYLIGLLYSYLLCTIYGVMTSDIFICGLFCFVLHLMGYIIMYLAVILAMMLTGKLVIGFFGTCVISLYAPAIYALAITLRETFFVTSYISTVDIEQALLVTRWISPASYYFSLLYSVENNRYSFWLELLSFLLLAAVLIALNLWLYKKRASEKADTAMSFKGTEPVIRILIAVPIGVLAGLLFFAIQYRQDSSIFWLVFGALLGGFLAHGIIEALYNGDIKKCLSHKMQMVLTMACAVVIPLIFLYDIFGYDSYLPGKKDIKSMAVVSSDMRFYGGSFYDENGWVSSVDYALENMQITDIDAMYELAALMSKDAGKNRTKQFFGYDYRTAEICYDDDVEKYRYTDFIIRYTLKNGTEVTRCYEYNIYAVLELLGQIYNNAEYKAMVHPVFCLLEHNFKPTYMECYAPVSGVSVKIEKNLDNIINTYAEDVLALSFDELRNSGAIGELTVHFMVKGGANEYEDTMCFLVYPSMTRTIALLKEQGYYMQGVQTADNIGNITVYYSGTANELRSLLDMEDSDWQISDWEIAEAYEEKYGEEAYTIAPEDYREISVTFSDPAEIAEIKKNLVHRSYVSEFGPFPEYCPFLNAEVYFENSTGSAYDAGLIGWTERFRFPEDRIPQFVIDRIFEELE